MPKQLLFGKGLPPAWLIRQQAYNLRFQRTPAKQAASFRRADQESNLSERLAVQADSFPGWLSEHLLIPLTRLKPLNARRIVAGQARRPELPGFGTVANVCALLGALAVIAVLLPVIQSNSQFLASGNTAAVAEEAWQELLQDVFAFTGLTSVFVGLREPGSSLAHATGALLYSVVFIQGLWTWWTDLMAIVGWALLPFLFCHNFLGGPSNASLGPSIAGGLLATGIVAIKRLGGLHREAAGFWDRNGLALAATATFMMEGAAELIKLLGDSAGYIPQQVMLNTAFVALLIPRSLFTQDSMFFIDVGWNALLGWGQLAVLFLLRHQLSGSSYLSIPAFAAATLGLCTLALARTGPGTCGTPRPSLYCRNACAIRTR
ncbi:hypothetical protein WJX73_004177 [Symbiochloris irregularis]|uniref:Uncharacterized protein n=1 Tax=Symbiochloris irregularis TaxID=706552 RepID=A0AAW1NTJ8_9CHLO